MNTGFETYEESHHLLYQNAKAFYAIASSGYKALSEDDNQERISSNVIMPILYNLCMALELSFKAFLLSKKIRKLGHNLVELFNECVERGLYKDEFYDDNMEILETLNRYHITKKEHEKEYGETTANFSQKLRYTNIGVYRLPLYYPTIEYVIKILEQIKNNCGKEIIEPHNFKPNTIIQEDKEKLRQLKEKEKLQRQSLGEIMNFIDGSAW